MRSFFLHALIGVLVGIIIMQWAIPAAESSPEILTVQGIVLKSQDGDTLGYFKDSPGMGGPVLVLKKGRQRITMNADKDGAFISIDHEAPRGSSVTITVKESSAGVIVKDSILGNSVALMGSKHAGITVERDGKRHSVP